MIDNRFALLMMMIMEEEIEDIRIVSLRVLTWDNSWSIRFEIR